MSLIRINHTPKRWQLNLFGFFWLLVFGALGCVAWLRQGIGPVAIGLWSLAVSVPVVGWIDARCMRIVFLATSYLAFPIGYVVSHIILGVVYYLVIGPIGLAMRLVGYDPLHRRLDRDAESYWIRREPPPPIDRYFKQF